MTAHSTTPAVIPGAVAAPTPTPSNEGPTPEAFAAECRRIVTTLSGDAAHRALDAAVTRTLTSLGYGEGMQVFIENVRTAHE